MATYTLIKNAKMVNEGEILAHDVLIKDSRIARVGYDLSHHTATVIDAQGKYLLPGLIDDQVHFREPGLTHKADIWSESIAAVAGGITSFMEMPNTIPHTLTQQLLQDKYDIASRSSVANYSFFMGASNDNIDEVMKTNKENVCGIKVFMGSSTGNMLVDDETTLTELFSRAEIIVAAHCEDEETIKSNTHRFAARYAGNIPFTAHPLIRSAAACYLSSSQAVALAQANNTKFHVLHISTSKETTLFDNALPLKDKKITSEACIHHLWFSDADYPTKGRWIKWNPAVKTADDRDRVFRAMLDDHIDIVATDHAPHTIDEKRHHYTDCPSGGPLVQHGLCAMLEHHLNGKVSLQKIVEKMCHNPAILFDIKDRGYIREGYYADLVLVDVTSPWRVSSANILSKCGWSPFEGQIFRSKITHTFVSGHLAYAEGRVDTATFGKRLVFDRK